MPEIASEARPISLKRWEVVALETGRLKELWRPANPQPAEAFLHRGVVAVVPQWPSQDGVRWFMRDGLSELVRCPYGKPGDRLWVRESHVFVYELEEGRLVVADADENERPQTVVYQATDKGFRLLDADGAIVKVPWKSPNLMPRWASRFSVEITAIEMCYDNPEKRWGWRLGIEAIRAPMPCQL